MKNETPIVLTLVSNGDQDEQMMLQVKGSAAQTARGLVISYTETMEDPDGGPSVSTEIRLLVRTGHLTMFRSGEYGSTMVFERGKRFETGYRTPYGTMDMAVVATKVDTVPQLEKGRVDLAYQLTISNVTSTRTMKIRWHAEHAVC